MEASYIAIWIPIFIVLFVVPQQTAVKKAAMIKIKNQKGKKTMTNELIKKYEGQNCYITSGSFGVSTSGKIVEVNENWIVVETKKGREMVNLDFVQNIRLK